MPQLFRNLVSGVSMSLFLFMIMAWMHILAAA